MESSQMEQVIFKVFQDEVVAIFPNLKYSNFSNLLTCYAHIGQHSGCSPELLKCTDATFEQYESLLNELNNDHYIYNCEVLNE